MHNERASFDAAPNLIVRSFHILFVREALDGGKSARLILRRLMPSALSRPYDLQDGFGLTEANIRRLPLTTHTIKTVPVISIFG